MWHYWTLFTRLLERDILKRSGSITANWWNIQLEILRIFLDKHWSMGINEVCLSFQLSQLDTATTLQIFQSPINVWISNISDFFTQKEVSYNMVDYICNISISIFIKFSVCSHTLKGGGNHQTLKSAGKGCLSLTINLKFKMWECSVHGW